MAHSALTEPLRPWDPDQIGGYTLIGRLGAGSMGQVYLGRSAAGRLVAVKTIRAEFAEQSDFRTRFAQEVAAARRVSGAFTAAVVASDPEADIPWLATAYVPAPSLSTLVTSCGPLSVPAVRWLAAGCAEALESIHGTGLVHRDLKPSNVLVSPDGPRVIDFGVARAAELIQLTLTRGTVGTPVYMSPEQARDNRQATTASDIYSLGATMLLASTGHGPYRGDTVMEVLAQLATRPPDLSGLPDELTDIAAACLQRDPAMRPTSAALLAYLSRDIDTDTDVLDLGPALLSGPALALIADYRRGLRPLAQPSANAGDGDDTFGSRPAPDPSPVQPRPAGEAGAGAPERAGPARRSSRRVRFMLASGLAAIALLGSGIALGSYVASGRASTASGTSARGTGSGGTTVAGASGTTGPLPGAPPPGAPPPGGDVRRQAILTGKPAMTVNQPFGDSHTTFVVIGAGFTPGLPVTIRLAGVGTSPDHPIADDAGTFNYVINQAHEFFRGPLPPGNYRVVVTEAGSTRVMTATFTVAPSQARPAHA